MSVSAVSSTSTQNQIDRVIQNRLNAADPNGKPNMFQQVAKLDISPQAKQQLETTMAQQLVTLHQGEKAQGQHLSAAQQSYVFNGAVEKAISAYQQGAGSLSGITTALAGRGERIGATLASQSGATPGASTPPAASTSQVNILA